MKEALIFIVGYTIVGTIVLIILVNIIEQIQRKIIEKRLDHIRFVCSYLTLEGISFIDKGTTFIIKSKYTNGERDELIGSNPYSYIDLYINSELVLRVHKLEGLWACSRIIRYSDKRSINEVNNLFKKAYKQSKSLMNEYYKRKENSKDNSFYKK